MLAHLKNYLFAQYLISYLMKKILGSVCLFLLCCITKAQVGIGTTAPDNSALLEIKSTTKGFLPPRMTTTERDAISAPVNGLQVFNTSTNCLELYINGIWQSLVCGCIAAPAASPNPAAHFYNSSQIVWNWNTVAGATGYKYNDVNNYTTAVDNGLSNVRIQTGITCTGAPNNLYIWAYNACGNSAPTQLSQSLEFPVSINKTGSGNGSVSSNPAGIACGLTCNASFICGTEITLTATPDVSSHFTGWSGGGCTGTAPCITTVTGALNVTASFALNTYQLTVIKSGPGNGVVVSTPSGINCGVDCSETYNYGTMVTLTAIPAPGSTFTGWSGACAGTGTCNVTMTSARTVMANFQ